MNFIQPGGQDTDKQSKRMTREGIKKAAENGDIEDQYKLAIIYLNGIAFPKDKKQAFEWFKKAAERGNGAAMVELALCYEKGEGTIMDKKQASEWFRRAAIAGFPDPQYNKKIY
jgi:TPR repeat protein